MEPPMSPNDPLAVLLAHDRWATEQLLAACAPLTDAQLDRPFEIGRGSLRKTLVHLHDVIAGWDDAIAGHAETPPLPADAALPAIAAAHPRVYDAFATTCAVGAADDSLSLQRGTRSIRAPRGGLLVHVLTHGTHTRAQALNMLRHLGVAPLPQSSVTEWMIATGAAQAASN